MATNSHQTWWGEPSTKKQELAVTLLAFLIVTIATLWSKRSASRTQKGAPPLPPGPRGLPILGYLPFLGPNLHHELTKMANRYGPIFKLHLGTKLLVVVNSPDLAKAVTSEHDESFANRDPHIAGRTASYGANDIAWSDNNASRRNLHRVFVHEVLSARNLEASHAYRRNEVRKTIKHVYDKVGTNVDMNEVSFVTELNVLTSIVWGKSLFEGAKGRELAAEIRGVVTSLVEIAGGLNLSDFFPFLARFDLQGVERDVKMQMKQMDRVFESTMAERRNPMSCHDVEHATAQDERKDFLQILLELKEQNNGNALNMTQIKGLVMDILLGGVDSTSAMVEWTMAEIIRNPKVMKNVQDELEETVGLNNVVEESHLPKLQYLEAVVRETFRLHPPQPFLLPRSPNKSCVVGGYTIPKGATVFLNAWAIHRDPQYWEDPSEFNPERFLNHTGSDKCDYRGRSSKFFPFGSGRRRCPGVPLAEKMLMHNVASLLHSFNWSLPEGEEHDVSDKFGIALKKRKPLVVIPSQRLADASLYV